MDRNISREEFLGGVKKYLSQFSDEELNRRLEERKKQIENERTERLKWIENRYPGLEDNFPEITATFELEKDRRKFRWTSSSALTRSTKSNLLEPAETCQLEIAA